MTFGEFLDYEHGFEFRRAYEWERTRKIMWASLAAMGGKETPSPKELQPLWTDNIGKVLEKPKEKEYLSDELTHKWLNSLDNG
jgi:hypothetical protein